MIKIYEVTWYDAHFNSAVMDIEDIAEELSEDAIAIAKHAGRKTIMADDLKLARKA